MDKPQLLDVVQLKQAATGFGFDDATAEVVVPKGETGTIVLVFDAPDEAYEVEVSDDYGETIAMVTLTPDQFDVVWRSDAVLAEQVGA